MHPLDGSFLKLRRADEHLQVANDLMKGFIKRKPYKTITEFIGQGRTRECLLRFEQLEDIPPTLPLLIGDVCNNLRSALDYLLWQLWLLKNPLFTKNVKFPIWDNENPFKKNASKDIGKDAIEGLTDTQRTTIEQLQPYKTGNRALSFLRDVNDSDKHRLIPIIFLIGNLESVIITIDQTRALLSVPLAKEILIQGVKHTKVEHGATICRIPFPYLSRPTRVNVKSKFTVEFAFEGCRTAHGQIIKKSISAMLSEASRAVSVFEPEFARFGTSEYTMHPFSSPIQ